MDIDNLPIGVKPTNKMTFEDLIEEKLKIADQLDQEQFEISKNRVKKSKKTQLQEQNESNDFETNPENDSNEITPNSDQENEPNEELENSETLMKIKPKKFLKRGEGLKRFFPNSKKNQPQKKKQNSNTNNSNLNRKSVSTSSSSNIKQTMTNQSNNKTNKQPVLNSTKPNSKPITKTNKQEPIKKSITTKPNPTIKNQINKKVEIEIESKNSDDEFKESNYFKSNQNDMKKIEHKSKHEDEHDGDEDDDLKEFESLEKYVEEHPSFRSTTSYLESYFSNDNSNNYYKYEKEESIKQQTPDSSSKIADILKELNLNKKITIENIYKNYKDLDENDFDEFITKNIQNEHKYNDDDDYENNRTINEDDIKNHNLSNVSSQSKSSQITRKVKRIYEKKVTEPEEIREEEYNKEDVMNFLNSKNSDYMSSNYKDDDDEDEFDDYKVATVQKKYEYESDEDNFESNYEKYLSNEDTNSLKKVKFDDTSSWLDQSARQDIYTNNEQNNYDYDDLNSNQNQKEPIVVSKLINKLFPSFKEEEEKQKQAILIEQQKKDKEIFDRIKQNQMMSKSDQTQTNINASLLKEKITQLENEIEKFQKKNTEINKLKEKLETEIKLAETNRKLFDKQKQDEFNRLKEVHDEEMRKLKQEKKIFEQYKQSIKDRPDRKERDEIDRLNRQVAELNEELKTREARWMANNNRLKERIESLEKEKSELKKELQLVEKQRIDSLIKMTSSLPVQSTMNTSLPTHQDLYQSNNHHMLKNPNFTTNKLTVSTNSFNSESSEFTNSQNMFLKRTTSEKSLPNSSPSSSSSSIGSTGSLALNSNLNLNQNFNHNHNNNNNNNNTNTNTQNMSNNQHFFKTNSTITSPLVSNSLESIKSDFRVQNHKTISPTQVVKSVKFNQEHLKETRYYSPNGTNLIDNEDLDYEYDYDSTSNTKKHDLNRLSQNEFIISSLNGTDRELRVKETRNVEGKHVDKLLEDDTLVTIFPNGTIKETSADKKKILVKFFNGDRKEMNRTTGTETYFYAETNITQIIYSNGLQIVKFPSGQIEKHHVDKTREIIFPDKVCKFIYPDNSEETRLPNGTCIKIDKNGDKVIEYPNKQKEIHTKEFKRREYPDGNVKTVYTNGLSETRYANGRIRIKDSLGNIISDSKV